MSSPPFDIAEGTPADTDIVSVYPAAERTFRSLVIDIINREHDLPSTGGSALHKFGVGSTATRDSTTDWVVGSIYFNTVTTPETIQLCVAVGPVTWRDLNPASSVTTGANTFTATQTIKSTDAGAGVGPDLILLRDSASPAASDLLGRLEFQGRDSAANLQEYGEIYGKITDPTSTSEDAEIHMQTVVGGTVADRFIVGQGVYTPSATGGDKGANTINASAVYDDGVQIVAATQAEMEAETAGAGKFVTAATARYFPGVAKAWVYFNAAGTTQASYNSTSTSKSATGIYTWTINTDFSSSSFAVVGMVFDTTSSGGGAIAVKVTSIAAGSVTVHVKSGNNADTDPDTGVFLVAFGDQ